MHFIGYCFLFLQAVVLLNGTKRSSFPSGSLTALLARADSTYNPYFYNLAHLAVTIGYMRGISLY